MITSTKENVMKKVKAYHDEDGQFLGIVEEYNKTFTAVTFTKSKTFKTLNGAEKWIRKCI